jgi:hypothetical protein
MTVNWHRRIWTVEANNGTPDAVPDELFQDNATNKFWLEAAVGDTEIEVENGTDTAVVNRAGFRVGFEPNAVAEGWAVGWLLVPLGHKPYGPGPFDPKTERLEGIGVVRGAPARLRIFVDKTTPTDKLVIRLGTPLTQGAEGLALAHPD